MSNKPVNQETPIPAQDQFKVGERVVVFDLPEYIEFYLADRLVTIAHIDDNIFIFESRAGLRQYIATKQLTEAMHHGEISIVSIDRIMR